MDLAFEWLSKPLRLEKGLPPNWVVYLVQLQPEQEPYTHVLVEGSIYRPRKSGKRKGEPTWFNEEKRQFLLSVQQYREYQNAAKLKPFSPAD